MPDEEPGKGIPPGASIGDTRLNDDHIEMWDGDNWVPITHDSPVSPDQAPNPEAF